MNDYSILNWSEKLQQVWSRIPSVLLFVFTELFSYVLEDDVAQYVLRIVSGEYISRQSAKAGTEPIVHWKENVSGQSEQARDA